MIEELVKDLMNTGLASFEISQHQFAVHFKLFHQNIRNVLDFKLFERDSWIGYLTLLNDRQGTYHVSHDPTGGVSHFDFSGQFVGIEVAKKYRNHGIGHALLSIGIRFAQNDYNERDTQNDFKVIAYGIGSKVDFYRKFGFEIKEEGFPAAFSNTFGVYKRLYVPEINIEE